MTRDELIAELSRWPVSCVDLLTVLQRGTAEVLYAGGGAVALRDACGTVLFWAGPKGRENEAAARAALPFLPKGALYAVHGELCARLVKEAFGCGDEIEPCLQARYLGALPPAPPPGVAIRPLGPEHEAIVWQHYHTVADEEYVRGRLAAGVVLGAFLAPQAGAPQPAGPLPKTPPCEGSGLPACGNGEQPAGQGEEQPGSQGEKQPAGQGEEHPASQGGEQPASQGEKQPGSQDEKQAGESLAGFVGLHGEGGIGMLEVFPQYRRRGLAEALMRGIMRQQMEQGLAPFGHIVAGNEPSIRLQTKLGFSFAEELVYWME